MAGRDLLCNIPQSPLALVSRTRLSVEAGEIYSVVVFSAYFYYVESSMAFALSNFGDFLVSARPVGTGGVSTEDVPIGSVSLSFAATGGGEARERSATAFAEAPGDCTSSAALVSNSLGGGVSSSSSTSSSLTTSRSNTLSVLAPSGFWATQTKLL